jgi:hypothetical protein
MIRTLSLNEISKIRIRWADNKEDKTKEIGDKKWTCKNLNILGGGVERNFSCSGVLTS